MSRPLCLQVSVWQGLSHRSHSARCVALAWSGQELCGCLPILLSVSKSCRTADGGCHAFDLISAFSSWSPRFSRLISALTWSPACFVPYPSLCSLREQTPPVVPFLAILLSIRQRGHLGPSSMGRGCLRLPPVRPVSNGHRDVDT